MQTSHDRLMDEWCVCVCSAHDESLNYFETDRIVPHILYFCEHHMLEQDLLHQGGYHTGIDHRFVPIGMYRQPSSFLLILILCKAEVLITVYAGLMAF